MSGNAETTDDQALFVLNWPFYVGVVGIVYTAALVALRHMAGEHRLISDPGLEGLQELVAIACLVPFRFFYNQSTYGDLPLIGSILALFSCIVELFIMRSVYRSYVCGRRFQTLDLCGKVYIVTGSNAGIGLETARNLVKMNGVVVMACRSVEKAEEAKKHIIVSTGKDAENIIVMKLDLCDFSSVRSFVEDFKRKKLPLHCLINNAGTILNERKVTKDDIEMTFQSNHLSSFLLNQLLLNDLEKTGGRIVNVASSMSRLPKEFYFGDYMVEQRPYKAFEAYSHSKLANVMTAIEQNNRLEAAKSKVRCNAVHPGITNTDLSNNLGTFASFILLLMGPILTYLQKTPSQGAFCSVFVATSPLLDGVGGYYFQDSMACTPGQGAMQPGHLAEMWDLSEKLSRVTPTTVGTLKTKEAPTSE